MAASALCTRENSHQPQLWIPKGLAQPPPHLSALTEKAFNNISKLCQKKKYIYISSHTSLRAHSLQPWFS